MSFVRKLERSLVRAIDHRLDAPDPPGPVLAWLGFPYLRVRHRALHAAIRAGWVWVPSAWRNALALALRPGDCFLDLGANIGRVTQEAAWRVGPSGSVHSFEPSSMAVGRLRRRRQRLGLVQVQINECAVGNRNGTATFYEYPQSHGGTSSLRPHAHANAPPAGLSEVPVVTVDDYLKSRAVETVALMKLDVEGAEVEALRGARHLLTQSRPRPVLIFEVAALAQASFGRDVQELLDLVQEFGYATWLCRPNGLVPIRREEDLQGHSLREDLLALHPQDHGKLERRLARHILPSTGIP